MSTTYIYQSKMVQNPEKQLKRDINKAKNSFK